METINKVKSFFFGKINEMGKSLPRVLRENREKQMIKIRKYERDITKDTADKRIS